MIIALKDVRSNGIRNLSDKAPDVRNEMWSCVPNAADTARPACVAADEFPQNVGALPITDVSLPNARSPSASNN